MISWVPRPEETTLASKLAQGARLVTVHGLGGTGASALVARVLAASERPFRRIDLSSPGWRRELERLRRPTGVTVRLWVDQAHKPLVLARTIARSLERDEHLELIVAARAPLGLAREHLVPLRPWSPMDLGLLLEAELDRLGVRDTEDLEPLIRRLDGWPALTLAIALRVRTLGLGWVTSEARSLVSRDPKSVNVVRQALAAVPAPARALLRELAAVRSSVTPGDLSELAEDPVSSLSTLEDHGLVVNDAGYVRARRFLVEPGGLPRPRAAARAPSSLLLTLLARSEQLRRVHRREPVRARRSLEALAPDLLELARGEAPDLAIRAILALEPLLVGQLDRTAPMELWDRARRHMHVGSVAQRAAIVLGLVRTSISRGDHESARALLETASELDATHVTRASRATYLGHIAAWRDESAQAEAMIERAARELATASRDDDVIDAAEDLLVQRMFLAFKAGDLAQLEAHARDAQERAQTRPSPRLGAIARRFVAEALLVAGDARAAAELLATTRSELAAFGDHAGAVFISSRLVEALRASGQHAAAEDEAERERARAARAGEATLELTFLGARGTAPGRVVELAWRAQIPSLRHDAARWLSGQSHDEPVRIRWDASARTVQLGDRSASFARRATLWRALEALFEAHALDRALDADALFAAGWPRVKISPTSRRRRVQTAIWTLRREVLGDLLITSAEGYRLTPSVRVEARR